MADSRPAKRARPTPEPETPPLDLDALRAERDRVAANGDEVRALELDQQIRAAEADL